MRRLALVLLPILAAAIAPVHAEVKSPSAAGFTIEHRYSVPVAPDKAWAMLIRPQRWWPSDHTWSGDRANLRVKPVAGGCWCERWKGGEAEHGRVIHIRKNELLRVNGAFGPMQDMALSGVLSIALAAKDAGTDLVVTYRISGTPQHQLEKLAPIVDKVLNQQFGLLVDALR